METKDIFESAFLHCVGIPLRSLVVNGKNGRTQVSFVFEESLKTEQALNDYRLGKANANIKRFKFSLNEVKDLMFREIRDLEKGEGNVRTNKDR